MRRYYYDDDVQDFCLRNEAEILGIIAGNNEFTSEQTQVESWKQQIAFLQKELDGFQGHLFFEFSIPRMGKRIDVLLIIGHVLFVLEYKVGEKDYPAYAIEQVWDYALDLKNFHEASHTVNIVPVLVATEARYAPITFEASHRNDGLYFPIKSNGRNLRQLISQCLQDCEPRENISISDWIQGRYAPTPTIIEAAIALYQGHDVTEITRSEANAQNLSVTCASVSQVIEQAKKDSQKAICFVTGVPGAGKTLVGLNIATQHLDRDANMSSVFLSGNGPLVAVLREALARDKVRRLKEQGGKAKKGEARSEVKMFIQNVHHYRDEYLKDEKAPFDHVAIFDEAQRAWNLEQTVNFMHRKKGVPNFHMSEPEFLISCLDRHQDWAVVVCLVGGGQEINTGEAGITEWIEAINRSYPHWQIHVSDQLREIEYAAGEALNLIQNHAHLHIKEELHLAVSQRSYRAESLSMLVKSLLDIDVKKARALYEQIREKYPIVLTRDLARAKRWVKRQARGSERYGLVVSSQAQRLKPYAIDVRTTTDPIHWFLDGKDDTRSSFYMEDVATEFVVQGLELDWSCVAWDGDFRFNGHGWEHCSFVGNKWQRINKAERRQYQKNAYRVLLTRARQGMIIVVPEGDPEDPTRKSEYYDSTYSYLDSIGFEKLQ